MLICEFIFRSSVTKEHLSRPRCVVKSFRESAFIEKVALDLRSTLRHMASLIKVPCIFSINGIMCEHAHDSNSTRPYKHTHPNSQASAYWVKVNKIDSHFGADPKNRPLQGELRKWHKRWHNTVLKKTKTVSDAAIACSNDGTIMCLRFTTLLFYTSIV